MQAALEIALAELALGPELDPADRAAVTAWLANSGVSGEDALALARDLPRLLIYRQLVRDNLRGALAATLPRTLARLGARFEQDFDAFLRAAPPRTRYLRDLTPSFLRFVVPRWGIDPSVPEYFADLARHEALQVELASLLGRSTDHVVAELALDRGVQFVPATRLVHYAWAVQRLPEDEASTELPERADTALFVYRSPEHEVRYLELSPFAAALLSALLMDELSLERALHRAAEELCLPLTDELLTRAAQLLADLADRGALLGKSSLDGERPAI